MDSNEIGAKLRVFRKKSGFDAKAISTKLLNDYGIRLAPKSLYNYETGRTSPNPDVLLALCDIYGIENPLSDLADYAFGGDPTLQSDGIEEIMLFENEFTPEEWMQIKGFVNYIIANHKANS